MTFENYTGGIHTKNNISVKTTQLILKKIVKYLWFFIHNVCKELNKYLKY